MKICFVAPRFPFPTIKGDTLRAYHQIRELSREHTVHLVAGAEHPVSDAALTEMRRYCAAIDVVRIGRFRSYATMAAYGIGSRLPLQVLYFDSPPFREALRRIVAQGSFDVVHAMTIRVAPAVLALSNIPVVVDFMDSFGANIATRRELVGPVVRRLYDLELERVARYEIEVARRTAGGFVIAELDRATIGEPELAIIPNGVDIDALAFSESERDPETIVFTGNMGYQPNVDAVTWFVSECWTALREQRPNLRFQIVGARPAPVVAALARIAGIEVTGPVPSMAPYLQRAAVAVCPIRCGSGMQNKILEAMAAGVPVVTTPFANRSIGARAEREIRVAGDPQAFVSAVVDLLANPEQARAQARAARALMETQFTWRQRSEQLVRLYADAVARHARNEVRAAS